MIALAAILLLLALLFDSGLLYFFAALTLVLRLSINYWLDRAGAHVRVERQVERRIFWGETAAVTLTARNEGSLPVPWLRLRDSCPLELNASGLALAIFSLRGGATYRAGYTITGRQRGLYALGPLSVTIGDVFGQELRTLATTMPRYVVVYPRIMTLDELNLPTLALLGDLRSRRKIVGDPARLAGVRDYQAGDPLHDIHWRATARVGALQVKQFQPSTSVQSAMFLEMARDGYDARDVVGAIEAAIVVAASFANHLIGHRQEVGLVTNGLVAIPADDVREDAATALLAADPAAVAVGEFMADDARARLLLVKAAPIRPGRGYAHLMRLLEQMARLRITPRGQDLASLLERHGTSLPWGSTVVVIAGALSSDMWITLHRLREAGLQVVLLAVEPRSDHSQLERRAHSMGIRFHLVDGQRIGASLARIGAV